MTYAVQYGRLLLLFFTLVHVTNSIHLTSGGIDHQNESSAAWEQMQSEAQTDWCAHLPVPKIGYFDYGYEYTTWHCLLPPLVKALKHHKLPAGPEAEEVRTSGDMYMFGVAQGESVATLHARFPFKRNFAFDSFKGLPPETDELSKIKVWSAGTFKPRASVEKIVNDGGGPNRTKVIPGFFNDSLTPEIVKQNDMGPAFYVDIDCDLYSSTYPVLDFLFQNRIARVGTLIGYDDWWTVACRLYYGKDKEKAKKVKTNYTSPLTVGEGLAHTQIAKKYGVSFRCVAGSCMPVSDFTTCHLNNHWAPVFVVEAIGSKSTHGFKFTEEQEKHWLGNMGVCKST